MKILMLDTEFLAPSGWKGKLHASDGLLYCMCSKWLGEDKVITHRLDDYGEDPFKAEKHMMRDIKKLLEQADVWVSWYGTGCDIPFIQTKLLEHGFSPLPNTKHVDLWRIVKRKLLLGANSMNYVSRWLKFSERKTPLVFKDWYKALAGNKRAFRSIIVHCEADVRVLEEAYKKLLPLVGDSLPNVNLVDKRGNSCPKCGTTGKMQKRGFQYAQVTKTQRYQCTSCGSWSKGPPERIKEITVR